MLDMLIGLCVSRPKSKAKHSVLELPQRTLLVLMVCWEDSRDSAYSHIRDYDLFYQNDTKQNQKKERGPEEFRYKLSRLLFPESHAGHAQSPQRQIGTTRVKCLPRLSIQGFN